LTLDVRNVRVSQTGRAFAGLAGGDGCWTEVPNTHSLGGQPDPAVDVSACRDACWNNDQCDGVDWNPGQSSGNQCYLVGPWVRTRQVRRNGITQHILDRTACGTIHHRIAEVKLGGSHPISDPAPLI